MGSKNQTHCKRGHPFDEHNTGIHRVKGRQDARRCLACKRMDTRRARGSAIPPDEPALSRSQCALYATLEDRLRRLAKVSLSADRLWDVYCAQQNRCGNPKRPTCKYGHPKTRESVNCRWVNTGTCRYVRADCRLCASRITTQSKARRQQKVDVFALVVQAAAVACDASQVEPWQGEKERERRRIAQAMQRYVATAQP